jgi:2-keto-3-deoxy-L-rhamnonate aldolase RhmA
LDIGAEGIVVPQVQSVDEVRKVIDACRYPPSGTRGYGPRRASSYGRDGGSHWIEQVNQQLFVAVQIENPSALAAVDEIANLEGLDSIVLGPYDLSLSLGYPGEIGHPEVQTALKRIIAAARNAGKHVGTGLAGSVAEALQAIKLGVQWLQCGDDYSYMIRQVDQLTLQIRAAHESDPAR